MWMNKCAVTALNANFSYFPELNLFIDLGKNDIEPIENELIYIACTLFKKA